jgi:hypothetical protein
MSRVSEEQACKNLDSDGRSCDESPDYMACPFIMCKEIDIKSNGDSNDIDVNLHPEKPTVRELQERTSFTDDLLLSQFDRGLQDALSRDILT